MAPTALEKAIHDRDSNKASIDVLEQELLDNATTPLTEPEVNHLLAMSKTLQSDLVELHKRIIHLTPPDLDAQELIFQQLFRKATILLGSFTGLKMAFPVSTTSRSTASTPVTPVSTDIRLPRLQLPTFDGTLHEWVSFSDMFITAVNDNASISKSQKLTYLRSQLKGEAARQIQSIIISDANYDIAWRQLQDRYQNDREIFYSLLSKFHDQPIVQTQSPSSVRQLIDVSQECIRSLHVLKLPVDQWDAHLLFVIMRKMDCTSKELWEQSLKDSSIPTLKSLFEFLEQRARALAANGLQLTPSSSKPQTRSQTGSSGKPQQHGDKKQKHQSYLVQNSKPANKCAFCSEQHYSIFKCQTFMGLTVQQRSEAIRKNKLCFNCLGEHMVPECPSIKGCKVCGAKHHSLIHRPKPEPASGQTVQDPEPRSQNFHTVTQSIPMTEEPPAFDSVLATSIVMVPDHMGQNQPCRIFMDQGSNTHYVTESCVKRLRAIRIKYASESTGLGDEPVSSSSAYSMVSVCSRFDSSIRYHVKALIVKKISSNLPLLSYDPTRWSHLQGLQLADPQWYKPQKIDMLLGAELFFAILKDGKKTGSFGSPVAINSEFGWLIGGGSNLTYSSNPQHQTHATTSTKSNSCQTSPSTPENTDQLLRKFWEIEEVPTHRLLTEEEVVCQIHFKSTYNRDEDGRFIVHLPFKSPCPVRGPSLKPAIKRLQYLERRLQNQPTYREEYLNFMKDYESLGHMIEIPPMEIDSNKMCYIPHHFVTKDSSTTTKFRVVFDASAKTANGVSLNDTMMVGPTIQDSLVEILIRFRLHKVAFTADVAKMYRQILVAPEEADLQRIVWREDPSLPIKHFKLLTVTYGTAAAPFLATRVLQELADTNKEPLPLASAIASRDFYVDDLMSGESSISEALESQSQLLQLMKSAGLSLRKWSSNSQEVLDALPPDLRETQSLLSLDPDSAVKTLGICWNPQFDQFRFKIV